MEDVTKLKRINYTALAVVVALATVCIAGMLAFRARHSFTREKWIEEPENRTRIVDDLLADHALLGMTRVEVLELLGDHDNESGYFAQEDRMVYWLGPERGLFSIDSEWLILDFDGDVVTGCEITRD